MLGFGYDHLVNRNHSQTWVVKWESQFLVVSVKANVSARLQTLPLFPLQYWRWHNHRYITNGAWTYANPPTYICCHLYYMILSSYSFACKTLIWNLSYIHTVYFKFCTFYFYLAVWIMVTGNVFIFIYFYSCGCTKCRTFDTGDRGSLPRPDWVIRLQKHWWRLGKDCPFG